MMIAGKSFSLMVCAWLAVLISGCAPSAPIPETTTPVAVSNTRVIAQDKDHLVLVAGDNETFTNLARTYLRDATLGWWIAEFNDGRLPTAGTTIVVPRSGQFAQTCCGTQSVPVLVYHRFGDGRSDMSVSANKFLAQMTYLRDNGYTVIRLSELADFIEGRRQLPARSVVITVDDGHPSFYDVAFPMLSNYAFPVTLFIYTDWVGQGGLNWRKLSELTASGLIDIESHSKTHSNMGIQLPEEDEEAYADRVRTEIVDSRRRLERKLGRNSRFFAYPYGDTSPVAIKLLTENDVDMAFTVQSGGNASFASRYMMRRTMVLGKWDLQQFANALEVTKREP